MSILGLIILIDLAGNIFDSEIHPLDEQQAFEKIKNVIC
jgi:hypothetical protein